MDYFSQFKKLDESHHSNVNADDNGNVKDVLAGKKSNSNSNGAAIDLKTLSPKKLEKLSYYQILGNIKMHSTPEQIKKAFHRACLKYHPDKEESSANLKASSSPASTPKKKGKKEEEKETKEDDMATANVDADAAADKPKKKGEDPVFLKVKEAFETLSDPKLRKSYDSTVDFDDSVPSASDVKSDYDFYKVFGACFERNLRFDAQNEPGLKAKNGKNGKNASGGGGGGGGGKKKKKNSNTNSKNGKKIPPTLGNDKTPIDQVHIFYDYWVRFESWRDFTLPATKTTEHDTDMAECRYEKRWMEKEISRKAKAMKKDEMARITKLVDRSMALDPRLLRERKRVEKEKKDKILHKKEQKEREERELKEKEEKEANETAVRELREKEERVQAKRKKEQEKKILRKARQGLRKAVLAEYNLEISSDYKTWDSFEDMNDDLELLCSSFDAIDLASLTAELTESQVEYKMSIVRDRANELKVGAAKKSKEEIETRDANRRAAAEKEAAAKAARSSAPWSTEELAALAKAVRKYPAGGANRWETIAQFVNNLCRLAEPRRKEECIERYNTIASNSMKAAAAELEGKATPKPTESEESSTTWTDEQNKQLEDGLAKFPSSMEKNERWASIAGGVTGKNKKECVQRFKAIRLALKKK